MSPGKVYLCLQHISVNANLFGNSVLEREIKLRFDNHELLMCPMIMTGNFSKRWKSEQGYVKRIIPFEEIDTLKGQPCEDKFIY